MHASPLYFVFHAVKQSSMLQQVPQHPGWNNNNAWTVASLPWHRLNGVSPMFTRPYVPQSLSSPLYDISPYASHVPQSPCYPEMFPSPVAPRTYITQSLCSPVPMFPIFPSPYVSQSLCSPAPVLPCPFVSQSL